MRKLLWTVALLLGGCQTWGPTWSEITGNRYTVTTLNRRPAIINQIDDQGSFASNPIKIEPGMHRLVLQGPAPGWQGGAPLQVYMLDAAAVQALLHQRSVREHDHAGLDAGHRLCRNHIGLQIVAAQK